MIDALRAWRTRLFGKPWFRSLRAWWRGVARPRSWLGVAVAVFAGTGIGFFLEALLIGSPLPLSAGMVSFALLTLGALALVAYGTYRQVREAQKAGLFVHLAVLPQESWRPRHDGDREGLARWAQEKWPGAIVLPSRITVSSLADSPDGSRPALSVVKAQLQEAADQLDAVLATRAQLMPNAASVNLLIGSRSDVAVQFGVQCAGLLPETFWLVADARDASSIDGYFRYEVCSASGKPPQQEGTTVLYLDFDKGSSGAPEALASTETAANDAVPIGSLDTTPAAYQKALTDIVAKLLQLDTRNLIVVGNGPQSLLFAAGVMATRLGFAVSAADFVGKPHEGAYGAVWRLDPAPSPQPSMQETSVVHPHRLAWTEVLNVVATVLGTAAVSLWVQWQFGQTHATDAYANVMLRALAIGLALAAGCYTVAMVASSWIWRWQTNPAFVISFTDSASLYRAGTRVIDAPAEVRESTDAAKMAAWIKDRLGDIHAAAPATVNVSVDLGADVWTDEAARARWDKVAHELRIGARTNVPLDFRRGSRRVALIKQEDTLAKLWQ